MFNNFCTTSCGLVCQESGQEVALQSITVNVTVGHMISHVESVLSYKNEKPNAIEALFKFPLDEGSAIYKMEAEIDGRRIVAECQEKIQAQQTYDEAKAKGMTTFLLREDENSGDIFKCFLGNLPSQKEAKLTIAYVSELQREINRAVKLTLPTVLNPRYHQASSIQNRDTGFSSFGFSANPLQQQPEQFTESGKGGYSFSLTISIQSQFRIDKIESETPEVTVSIEKPDKLSAQASYATEDCKLSTDLTLYIQYEDDSQPTAIIERGSAGQDGIMKSDMLLLNFYPEFQEITSKCGEFIFVIDRSGNMCAGSNISDAVETLILLVRSLQDGCYFNIVSFPGPFNMYSTKLFQRSVIYTKEKMTLAVNHIRTTDVRPSFATDLYLPLLQIYNEPLVPGHPRKLFVITASQNKSNKQSFDLVRQNSKQTRVFSIGIGQCAATALVKGLARAGHGRYEFVQGQERLQQKVMALMKCSLHPELTNVTLDWNLSQNVSVVMIPEKLPRVFVGEMVTLYASMTGAERQEKVGGAVKMKGCIGDLPLEYILEFEAQAQVIETTEAAPIHRLAALAFVKNLEVEEMANNNIDKKSDIVLVSVAANIISKYTSFVGMDNDSNVQVVQPVSNVATAGGCFSGSNKLSFGGAPPADKSVFGTAGGFTGFSRSTQASFGATSPTGGPLFGTAGEGVSGSTQSSFGAASPTGGGGVSGSTQSIFGIPAGTGLFGTALGFTGVSGSTQSSFGSALPIGRGLFGTDERGLFGTTLSSFGCKQTSAGFHGFGFGNGSQLFGNSTSGGIGLRNDCQKSARINDAMIAVISLQDVDGSWTSSDKLIELMEIPLTFTQQPEGTDGTCWMTCLVLAWLEYKQSNRKDEWELLYNKAADWLISKLGAETFAALKTSALDTFIRYRGRKKQARRITRAAPFDLTEKDLVVDPEVLANPIRVRNEDRNNGPNTSTAPVMTNANTTAQPTADQIAAAIVTQLKEAGLLFTGSSGVRTSDDRLSSVTQEAVSSTDHQTGGHNTLLSSSTNVVHRSLVPLSTPEQSVAGYFTASSQTAQEDQGIDNSVEGQTAIYFFRNTSQLGSNVSEKIRNDIWADRYVDFITLSPNLNKDEVDNVFFSLEAAKISTNAKPKQLMTIHQWSAAFDIYMSIYYVNHPEHILSLIKYAYNVRAMSKQFGFIMAKSYDEAFRKERRVMKLDWAVVNDDLWQTAFYDHFDLVNTNYT